MKSKGIAVPYVIWMAIFVVAPLLIIVFYAFTSQSGGFTLENFSTMAQYTGVFGRSFLLAIIATFICLLIGYPLSYWLAQESPAVRRVAMIAHHAAHVDELPAAHLLLDVPCWRSGGSDQQLSGPGFRYRPPSR